MAYMVRIIMGIWDTSEEIITELMDMVYMVLLVSTMLSMVLGDILEGISMHFMEKGGLAIHRVI